ncbi:TetR/AcrR family transcriptional regulator [Bacillus sp. FJAT-26390]|uniref:TetR/AcrR family transcriptional regulator n=1 Tax=Bacillus sp. FJAT-26390 TaxID=1743142 RepID=UPI000807B3C8|nr:TetR/AcrR family transcriptional regulator [Bacillus sp. FJAT-26390]OBZ16828.1 transcriptional regulator [Bacillus sp. FJAT-26390]
MAIDNLVPKRKRLLVAASIIVREQGVEHLTLEAVAKAAGVSKGGLLYHFPSKDALINGMVEDLTNAFVEDIQDRVHRDLQPNGRWSRAYVESTFRGFEDGLEMSSILSAALFTNPELLQQMQEQYAVWQKNIENDGLNPIRSTIARLAADGLWFSEMFGLAPLEKDARELIFNELMAWTKEDHT